MKVVMVTHDRKIDRRIIQEAKSLMNNGYQVSIVAFPWTGEEDDDTGSIKIIRASESAHKRNIFSHIMTIYSVFSKQLFNNPYLMYRIRNIVNGCLIDVQKYFENFLLGLAIKEHGDIYHAHDLPSLSSAYKAAEHYGALLVYDSHELYCGQEFGKLEASKWKKIESNLINKTDAIITINKSIAGLLREWYGCTEPVIIMNKVNSNVSRFGKTERIIHNLLNLELSVPILLYQGSITTSRNLENLIIAMKNINSKAALVFLGSGSSKEKLITLSEKNNLRQRVFFIDEVPQNELLRYTAAADIGLIPYLGVCLNSYYCTPNKLFEFISAGVPILANNLPEINEIVIGEGIGLVTDFSKPESIAHSIDSMLGNKEALVNYRKRINQIIDKYSWDCEQEKLVDLYNKLAATR